MKQSRLKGILEVSSVGLLPKQEQIQRWIRLWPHPAKFCKSPGLEVLGVALKILESVVLLLINVLRCLTEI